MSVAGVAGGAGAAPADGAAPPPRPAPSPPPPPPPPAVRGARLTGSASSASGVTRYVLDVEVADAGAGGGGRRMLLYKRYSAFARLHAGLLRLRAPAERPPTAALPRLTSRKLPPASAAARRALVAKREAKLGAYLEAVVELAAAFPPVAALLADFAAAPDGADADGAAGGGGGDGGGDALAGASEAELERLSAFEEKYFPRMGGSVGGVGGEEDEEEEGGGGVP